MKKRIPAVLAALCALLAVISYGYKHRNAASIGIIGGADGPTAIFVTSKPNLMFYIAAALLVIAAGVLVVYIVKKKK